MYRIFKKQVAILALLIAPLFLHTTSAKADSHEWSFSSNMGFMSIKLEVQAMVVLI